MIDRAALGVTELLTNVHLHARPGKLCTVEIELRLDRLTVSVHDLDPRLPEVQDATSSATCGRGLSMVAAVSESWGARPNGESGKVVWFTLAAPSPAPAPAPVRPPFATVVESPVRGFVEVEPVTETHALQGHAPARSAVAG